MGKSERREEAAHTSITIYAKQESYHGQSAQPETTHPHRQHLCSSQSAKSVGTGLAKLLLCLEQMGFKQRLEIYKQATGKMVQMEQTDEPVQEPQMAEYFV